LVAVNGKQVNLGACAGEIVAVVICVVKAENLLRIGLAGRTGETSSAGIITCVHAYFLA
jgi:hypothetical protein